MHTLPWRFRNHMPDSVGLSFFGANASVFDRVGAEPLRAQLYMSMLGQALYYKSELEAWRSTNIHGSLTWDLGEIWPTVNSGRFSAICRWNLAILDGTLDRVAGDRSSSGASRLGNCRAVRS